MQQLEDGATELNDGSTETDPSVQRFGAASPGGLWDGHYEAVPCSPMQEFH